MDINLQSQLDERLRELIDEASGLDIESNDFALAAKNLRLFSEVRPLLPEAEPTSTTVPATKWGRFKAGTAAVWDNETTRVFIKAGGAFAGVGLVVWSTIHKDHVMERQALAQANQRNS